MKIESDLIFIDTNILIYSTYSLLEYEYKIANSFLIKNKDICISKQIINEYFKFFSNRKLFKENPIPTNKILKNIEYYLLTCVLLKEIDFRIDVYTETYFYQYDDVTESPL